MVSFGEAGPLTREEERSIQEALARDEPPHCPRCGHLLDTTPVPPRPEVSYVRSRILLLCPRCKLRGAVDLK